MSVVCGRPCYFNNGVYCKKDIIILNGLGQCEEHWGKQGQPIMMRDPHIENKMDDLEKVQEKVEENIEKCEDKGDTDDLNSKMDDGEMSPDTEKGAETQDAT